MSDRVLSNPAAEYIASGKRPIQTGDGPPWVTWITWLAIVAPLVYGLSRALWAVGLPIAITSEQLQDLGLPGTSSISLVLLALPAVATGLFTYAFLLNHPQTFPRWIPSVGGRVVRPWMVIAPLLLPIVILAYANVVNLIAVFTDLAPAGDMAELPTWSLWGHVLLFLIWGVALTISTLAYYRGTRDY